ncbi:hypothetical protein BRARA_I03618 [Brassica rapa]|uniref:Uncharacterized protein n=1 Tax=Brassica campestris TaxID=3711 RepID=A0A397Y5I8_BRACM|nr:hypothetical protein BRARA_I03618 [Brassica rapa]
MSIFLCFLLLFPLSLIFIKKLSSSKGKRPPGPMGLPIIGNLHQLGRFLHKSLHKISHEYGPVMSLRFGVVPVVVVSSKEGAEEVLKTHDLETCSRPKTVGTGLFTYNFKDIGFAPFDHSDIISVMLDMISKPSKGDSFKVTDDHLKGVMSDVFLAGVNAGAITMIWAMTELSRHPRVMKKLQEDIRTTLGPNKEKITEEDLEKVEYLKLVIEETFRLHPPAPLLLPRLTISDVKIQGYNIPKNTMIQINTYAIGRDPKYWTKPDEFIPERFVDNPIEYKGKHFELLPFGAGRRICPGMGTGITIVELGLLNLLYFFDWSLPEGMTIKDIDMEEDGAFVIAKKVPLELVPTRHRW